MRYITEIDRIFYKLDREHLWMQQNNKCFYCKKVLLKSEITFDHVIPLSKVKNIHSVENCVVACSNCNNCKKDATTYTPESWEIQLIDGLDKLEQRTRKATYTISVYSGMEDSKGSFNKWNKFWEKRKRF